MFNLQYAVATHNATAAHATAAALQQQVTAAYTVTVTKQTNNVYNVIVLRAFTSYTAAVNAFNNTVAQFCTTAAQYICSNDSPASCYVICTKTKQAVY